MIVNGEPARGYTIEPGGKWDFATVEDCDGYDKWLADLQRGPEHIERGRQVNGPFPTQAALDKMNREADARPPSKRSGKDGRGGAGSGGRGPDLSGRHVRLAAKALPSFFWDRYNNDITETAGAASAPNLKFNKENFAEIYQMLHRIERQIARAVSFVQANLDDQDVQEVVTGWLIKSAQQSLLSDSTSILDINSHYRSNIFRDFEETAENRVLDVDVAHPT
jgi:hypothetical protein